MDRIFINLRGVDTRMEFWRVIRNSLECPEYFGNNMDALKDVLSEIAGPTELVFVDMDDFGKNMPEYASVLDEMLTDLVLEYEDIYVSYEEYIGE